MPVNLQRRAGHLPRVKPLLVIDQVSYDETCGCAQWSTISAAPDRSLRSGKMCSSHPFAIQGARMVLSGRITRPGPTWETPLAVIRGLSH